MRKALHALFAILLLVSACRKNDAVQPAPPDTKIFVDKINLSGNLRLGTSVELHWTGSSANGYITGYEFSFDQVKWAYTKKADSTFLFNLLKGQDSSDINLYIRSIDNLGQKDPSPAKLLIPIKNAAPDVIFSKAKILPDTVYTIFSIEWAAHDKDGDNTIDSIFIKLNDGHWFALNQAVDFATFVPENAGGSGKMNASVYTGHTPLLLKSNIDGLKLNGINKLYIKARDNAGIYSAIDSTASFYIKNKQSDLLVINANASVSPDGDQLRTIVSQVYGKYDYVDFARNTQKYAPLYWTPTFSMQLRLYDKVFIYSDGLQINSKLLLEYAAAALTDYLNHGGKLMTCTRLPIDLAPTSEIYNYSPADSISTSTGQSRFLKDSLATPDPTNAAGYPSLKNSSFILGFEPIYLKPDAKPMYKAHIAKVAGWRGPDVVAAKTINTNGKTNQIFWATDLTLMDGDIPALTDFFNKALLHEFNW